MKKQADWLKTIVSDAFIDTIKGVLTIDEKTFLRENAAFLPRLLVGVGTHLIPAFTGHLLSQLFHQQERELKKMSKQLSKLVREPFLIGMHQLRTSLALDLKTS